MIWDALIKAALLGTDRAALPEEEKEKLRSLHLDPDADPARAVLEGAAFYAPVIRAGYQAQSRSVPLPAPAPPEDQQPCGEKAARHLQQILSGRFQSALPEYIRLMVRHRLHLPFESLPDLLQQSIQHPDLWQEIQAIVGQRGGWLIEQNPEWAVLKSVEAPDIDWYLANSRERIRFLQHLRRHAPADAPALLQTTWAEDPLTDRIQYLKTLSIGLTGEDEIFLENLLDDRRKEIRTTAAQLLIQLPNSALVNRVFDRTIQLLEISGTKKIKLKLEPPDALSEAMIRDGVGSVSKKMKSGLKAAWLTQMFSTIPASRWEHHFNLPARELLALFARTNWGVAVLEGIRHSALRHREENWLHELILFWVKTREQPKWESFSMEDSLEDISDELFNNTAIDILKKEGSSAEEDSPVNQLLSSGQHQWSNPLFLLFFQRLQQWLSSSPARYWQGRTYRNILKKAAYGCSVGMLESVKKSYTTPGFHWTGWEKDIDQFMRILRFRKEMTEAIAGQAIKK